MPLTVDQIRKLEAVRNIASWSPVNERELEAAKEEARRVLPAGDATELIAKYQQAGEKSRELTRLLKEAAQSDVRSAQAQQRYQEMCSNNFLKGRADKVITFAVKNLLRSPKWGKVMFDEIQAMYPKVNLNEFAQVVPIPDIAMGTEHRISMLPPADSWTLYVDETGNTFEEEHPNRRSRIVGVLLPKGCGLQALPGFHGVTAQTGNVLKHLDTLLRHHPCGVLGLELEDMHEMSHAKWLAALQELVRWVWRLIPLAEPPQASLLRVVVENRGAFKPTTDVDMFLKALNTDLDKESPERWKRLPVKGFQFVGKTADPMIAWADVVAYSWGTSDKMISEQLKKRSELLGACLLSQVQDILPVWEQAYLGRPPLTGPQWQKLQERPDADKKGSMTFGALQKLRESCVAAPDLWLVYLKQLERYLDLKRYGLAVVEREIKWLMPMGSAGLRKSDLFFWKLVELAHHNHQGIVGTQELKDCMTIVESLAPEIRPAKPEAFCQAQLRLAVADANAFDFDAAIRRLAPWTNSREPSALWQGKILSSLGQYRAFQGDADGALGYFQLALESFKELEGLFPNEARAQMGQTSVFAAIAAQDSASLNIKARRRYLEKCLGQPLDTGLIDRYGRSGDRMPPYLHHALLRYIVLHGTQAEQEAYRKTSGKWLPNGSGAGHPWPIIQFYRAWLVGPGQSLHAELILNAHGDAWANPSRGLTMHLIMLTIIVASGSLGRGDPEVLTAIETLTQKLPKAADRIALLGDPNGPTGLELFKQVLPFNYR